MITGFTIISYELVRTATHVAIDQIMTNSTVPAWIRFTFIDFFNKKFFKKLFITFSSQINKPISQKVPLKPELAQLQA